MDHATATERAISATTLTNQWIEARRTKGGTQMAQSMIQETNNVAIARQKLREALDTDQCGYAAAEIVDAVEEYVSARLAAHKPQYKKERKKEEDDAI